MARQAAQGRHQLGHLRKACPVSWGSVRGRDAQNAVFGRRASGLCLVALPPEPIGRCVELGVCGVDQRNQCVDVEQKPAHGNSSRCWATSSGVTGRDPARTASKGTPFRSCRREAMGFSACLDKAEITSPTLLFCLAASPLATASTSSSMVNVVRMWRVPGCTSNIKNHGFSSAMPVGSDFVAAKSWRALADLFG